MNDNKILMIYSSKKIAIISLCIARVKINLNTEQNPCYILVNYRVKNSLTI